MDTVGVRELKRRTAQILRRVRQQQVQVQITHRSKVVALLIPVPAAKTAVGEAVWADLDQLAAEISAHWPPGLTAMDALQADPR